MRGDVDYLLDTVNRSFGVEPITDEDILSAWSGLRPVLWAEGKKPSEISRRHEIMEGSGGMLTVAGGKLTSYRSMAERVVDLCEERLGRDLTPATTAEEPLPGGDFSGTFRELSSFVEAQGLAPDEADRVIRLYGKDAFAVFAEKKGVDAEVQQAVLNEGSAYPGGLLVPAKRPGPFQHRDEPRRPGGGGRTHGRITRLVGRGKGASNSGMPRQERARDEFPSASAGGSPFLRLGATLPNSPFEAPCRRGYLMK